MTFTSANCPAGQSRWGENLEEELLGIHRVDDHQKLKEYLRSFLKNTPLLMRPFIEGDPDPKYGKIDPELEKLREQMISEETDRGYLDGGNEPPTTGKTVEPSEPKNPAPDR